MIVVAPLPLCFVRGLARSDEGGDAHVPDRLGLLIVCRLADAHGHGALGDKVSHFVMNKVQEILEKHEQLKDKPEIALQETFEKVDKDLKADKSIDAELSTKRRSRHS